MSNTENAELATGALSHFSGELGSVVSAGSIEPSTGDLFKLERDDQWHKTLKVGDIVTMVEDPLFNNWLLRISDYTLHELRCADYEYVYLREVIAA